MTDDTTQSAATRYAYTNDILTVVIFVATVGFIYTGVSIPAMWELVVGLAAIWLFGPKTVSALNELRGKT